MMLRASMPGSIRQVRAAIACALIVVVAGGFASRRVDTRGMDRSPLLALVRTSFPRIRGHAANESWRTSPYASARNAELARLRGAAAGRNVVLVVLESTAAQYLRSYGAAEDPMPNLTALAARSIVFENAYAVYPESVKGLVALLASRYPAFDVPAERHAPLMQTSLATSLAGAGYHTALFHSGRFFYLGMDTLVFSAGFGHTVDAGDIGGNHNSSFGIDESSAVSGVLQWIDGQPRERPFFVAYLPVAGHHPYAYNIAPRFSEKLEIDRYRNALFESDAALGQLLAGLRDRQLDRSTVMVVIGDHGEAFFQHPGNYGHSLALYDENVRVPFMISLPASDRATRVERPVSAIDVSPTILDLLGVNRPHTFEGTSVLNGETNMSLFFADYSLGLLGVRDGCLKVIHELESRRSKLFDVCADPAENADLARQQPERVKFYRDRLEAWSAAQVAQVR